MDEKKSNNIQNSENNSTFSKKKEDNNKKKTIEGEIDILITNVSKEQFAQLTSSNCKKYFLSNSTGNLPDRFNIIVEACLNLSTQMKNKKAQIKKYNVLAQLIEELYSKNPKYIDDYLFPFKDKIQNINMPPKFVFIIATNSAYEFFTKSSKKFLEDKEVNFNCYLLISYIKFKLNDRELDLLENNEDEIMKTKVKKMEEDIIKFQLQMKRCKIICQEEIHIW